MKEIVAYSFMPQQSTAVTLKTQDAVVGNVRKKFDVGDWVIYRITKGSAHPGPRAKDVYPAPKGEGYRYHVDKFWVVTEVCEGGKVRVRTRRGKEHVVSEDDPLLRRANWWDRLWHRSRFPQLADAAGSTQ